MEPIGKEIIILFKSVQCTNPSADPWCDINVLMFQFFLRFSSPYNRGGLAMLHEGDSHQFLSWIEYI